MTIRILASQSLSKFALATLLSVAGCGRFDFGTNASFEGQVPVAKFLTLDAGTGVGFGGCSAVNIKAWSTTSIPGAPSTNQVLSLTGLRSGDKIYSDQNCSNAAQPTALSLAANALSSVFYIQAGSLGPLTLTISGGGLASSPTSITVKTVLAKVVYSIPAGTVTVGAGFCSSAIAFALEDSSGHPFSASQQIQIAGGNGLAYSDASCTVPIPSGILNIVGSSNGTFYVKSPHVVTGNTPMTLEVVGNSLAQTDSRNFVFQSVPYKLAISGGAPSGHVTLGLCDPNAVQVQVQDVDNGSVNPSTALTAQLQSTNSSTVSFFASCSSGNRAITSLLIGPGSSKASFNLEPTSTGTIVLQATASGLTQALFPASPQPALIVDDIPLYYSISGPNTLVAGSTSGLYTLTLKDGILGQIATSSPIAFTFNTGATDLGSAGIYCSSTPCTSANAVTQVTVQANTSSIGFYFLPNANDPNETLSLTLSASGFSGASTFQVSIGVRVPTQVAFGGGPTALAVGATSPEPNLNLAQCQPVPFTINLLDSNNSPVNPAAGTSLIVSLGPSGTAVYRTGSCNGPGVTQLTFNSSQNVQSVYVTARGYNQVNLTASSGNLTQGFLAVGVTTVAVALSIAGPQTVTAGVPAGPYFVSVVDGLGNAFTSGVGGVSANVSASSSMAATYYTSLAATTVMTVTPINVLPNGTTSVPFYIYSDASATVPVPLQAADVAGKLTAASLTINVVRNSLSPDPGFGASGKVLGTFSGFSGGAILASNYSSGSLVNAGYLLNGGTKQLALARYFASRAKGEGTLDGTFGTAGLTTFSLGAESWIAGIAMQNSSYLAAAVQKNVTSGDHDILLLRFNSNGTPDTTFRYSGGLPEAIVLAGEQIPTAILQGLDGSIYVIGYADAEAPTATNTTDFFIAAFQSDGTLIVMNYVDFGAADYAQAAVLESISGQDRILMGGSTNLNGGDFAFARVLGVAGSAGTQVLSLDSSFGTAGLETFDMGMSASDSLKGMIVESSGRVVGVGTTLVSVGTSYVAALGLTGSNGVVDTAFANKGYFLSNTSANAITANCVVSAPDGTLYIGGVENQVLFAASLSSDGSTFNSTTQPGNSTPAVANSIQIGESSKPILSGSANGIWTTNQLLR